jgi:hypothetical protein
VTNHDESTQDEPVADTPAPVKRRPTRAVIALEAVFLGLMAGVLSWLVAGELEEPSTWGRVGVLAYAGLTGFYLWGLVKLLRRRWAKEPVSTTPTGYVDRDGDRWFVRPDGLLAYEWADYGSNGGIWPRDVVEREFGPLTPIHD